jgi:tetratricopeptide (TPR) repeat protein
MHDFGVRDVERLLHLSRGTIRALVDAGFVSPTRGARNSWRFSFQDLIVLRTAQALVEANIPKRRITRSVRELRRHLPETMPLSGLSISAVGDRVAVREGGRSRWEAGSGQYVLEFEVDPAGPALRIVERPAAARAREDDDSFNRAVALERDDPEAAIRAYREALAEEPANPDASLNLGRLLHELRRHAEAEGVYRQALARHGDALLHFNLGVLLEDMGRRSDAAKAYEDALRADASLADAHCNLALLYEKLGRPKDAIRHLAMYRRLAR